MNDLFSIVRKNDNPSGHIIWSQEQIAFVINEYNSHHSTTKIANQFGVSNEAIRTLLRKNNQKVLSLKELQLLNFPRNSYYFNKIDSAEKAYWLGFLYADGYISKDGSVRINLKKDDEEHLKKFLKSISATNTQIKYSEKRENDKIFYQCYTALRDSQMVSDLADKGCINNKSLILAFPKNKVPEKFYSHFIRGYFDGDGSIHFTKSGRAKTPNYRISFTGTEDMLKNIKAILNKDNLSLECKGNYFVLSINGNKQLESILSFIYKDSYDNIELTRKRQIYDNFLLQRVGGEPVNAGCE